MHKYMIMIQARLSSKRFPKKVLTEICGEAMIFRQYTRLSENLNIPICIISSSDKSDDELYNYCLNKNINVFRGDLNNVFNRFYEAAKYFNVENIIRVGGDDPLIDPNCVKSIIEVNEEKKYDFIYASHKEGWPYGCAAELISINVFKSANQDEMTDFEKEHTIPYIFNKSNMFSIKKVYAPNNLRNNYIKLSVDYEEDFEIIKFIFSKNLNPTMYEIIKLSTENKEIFNSNQHLHSGFDR